jgi:YD repeat-containing protein
MKLFSVCFFLIFLYQDIQSQDFVNPPSPNAVALGKYGEVPVSNYTGIPNVDLPIYQISQPGLSLPISLSYHGGGVKVDDLPSWVGMNWSILGHSVITRAVRGLDDFLPSAGFLDLGLLLPQPESTISENCSINGVNYTGLFNGAARGNIDTQPDLFNVSVGGYSIKFFFKQDRSIVVIPDQKIRIIPPENFDPSGEWVITTPDGTKYFFGGSGLIERTNVRSGEMSHVSAWYLKKIQSISDPQNPIQLLYHPADTVQYPLNFYFVRLECEPYFTVQSLQFVKEERYANIGGYYGFNECGNELSRMNLYISSPKGTQLALRRITYKTGYIEFNSEKIFCNEGTPLYNLRNLKTIKVYDLENRLYKTFTFRYSRNHYNDDENLQSAPNSDPSRFWLRGMDESGSTRDVKKFRFSYFEGDIPKQGSLNQDKWGFSNSDVDGVSALNTNFTNGSQSYLNLLPSQEALGFYCIDSQGGVCHEFSNTIPQIYGGLRNVESDLNYAKIGSLREIIYPTGGSTSFDYELNQFYDYYINQSLKSPLVIGGGLRLSRLVDYDPLTSTSIPTTYSYGLGLSMSPTVLSQRIVVYEPHLVSDLGTNLAGFFMKTYFARYSRSAVSMGSTSGSYIGYSTVSVNKQGHGLSVFNYTNVQDRINQSPVTYSITNSNLSFFGMNRPIPSIPNTSYSHLNGKPVMISHYKGSNGVYKITKRTINTYELANDFTYKTPYISAFGNSIDYLHVTNMNNRQCSPNGLLFQYIDTSTGFYFLKQAEDTYYEYPNDAATPVEIVKKTTFIYDNLVHYQPTRIVTNTNANETITTYSTYPEDYADISGVIKELKDAFLVVPVEKTVLKENTNVPNSARIISGEITTYKLGTKGLKDIVYMLNTNSSPIRLSTFKLSNKSAGTTDISSATANTTFSKDALYEPRLTYQLYDADGNVRQLAKNDDASYSYLWDYSNAYPVAEVKNGLQSNIAHTSFEADGKGNWTTISSSSISTENLTGLKSYQLSAAATVSKSGLNPSQTYILSFWAKSGLGIPTVSDGNATAGQEKNGWSYYEKVFTGRSSVMISGAGIIDELRLYPKDAQMTTYTYSPGIGMTSATDVNNVTTYYEYDSFGRLQCIKDDTGNVLKKYDYTYQIK